MGIFSSFRKSTGQKDDDLVASDDWLMGLSDGEDTPLEELASGPNATVGSHDAIDHLPTASFTTAADPSEPTPSPGATWHFPDLQTPDDEAADEILPDTDADPFEPTPPAAAVPAPPTAVSRHDGSVPDAPEAQVLLEILGVPTTASWAEISAAHAAAIAEYDPTAEVDSERVELANALRREMNTTYAALRLMSAK